MRQKKLSKLNPSDFRLIINNKTTDLFYLKNKNDLEMTATNFGARVVELWTPDKDGHFDDIVLGHGTLEEYIHFEGERFLGAAIGRFGNRIANGKFVLNGVEYQLPINDNPNSLHGGNIGFDMVVWEVVQPDDQTLEFSYLSEDGEEGYPGNLLTKMTYQLNDNNEFIITYKAKTDKTTIVNLTHHSFFNLLGEGNGSVNNHILSIYADKYLPINEAMIPTGEEAPVENTPMDFRTPITIGERLNRKHPQLALARGYDHNWILNRKTDVEPQLAACVYEPVSGRTMEVRTTEPGIQFYGGNFFDGKTKGKDGKSYHFRTSFALETQHYPDSPNHSGFPSAELSPGEEYHHVCIYKFGTRQQSGE